jgi:uroporphyrinogen-III synthase
MPYDGLRVLALESRRAAEIETLIRKQGGAPFVAPSMREVPLEANDEVFAFAERLFGGGFDGVILLTGVGTRILWKKLLTRYDEERLKKAFGNVTLVARGPKPAGALREMGLTPAVQAPEPNTWHEILAALRGRPEKRLALQEYGKASTELTEALRSEGREVVPFRVYAWDLPEDTRPLREAVAKLIAGAFDVALFTTSTQITNLFRIAAEEGVEEQVREALRSAVTASIGPTTSEALEDHGVRPDFEPSHTRMGLLVAESAAEAARLLAGKR